MVFLTEPPGSEPSRKGVFPGVLEMLMPSISVPPPRVHAPKKKTKKMMEKKKKQTKKQKRDD